MFPVDGFQFVFCGLATLAASVGYACTRNMTPNFRSHPTSNPTDSAIKADRSASLSPDEKHASQNPALFGSHIFSAEQDSAVLESTSLKRKHSGDDDCPDDAGYSHNEPAIYPNKRSRTPSSDNDSDLVWTPLIEDYVIIPSPTKQAKPIAPVVCEELCEEPLETDSISPHNDAGMPLIPSAVTPPLPSYLPSRPGSPPAQFTATRSKPSDGFAAFASSRSTFGKAASSCPSPSANEAPIWHTRVDAQGQSSLNPLAAETHSKTTYTHITGEEDEEVESEIKGVKLYINRGNKGFTDGMAGHVKLLSNKATKFERLLFRRDPLLQVTMNIALSPLVRCIFDEEALALRLIHKEPIMQENMPAGQKPTEVVIYVLKRGRATKESFREFAESLMGSSHLNAR